MKNQPTIPRILKGIQRSTKTTLFSFCFLFLILTATVNVQAKEVEPARPVSPALCVLAEQNSMAMAGVKGNGIRLVGEDFARAMNLSRVSSVTVTQVPPLTDGELRVGSTVVNNGQTVSGGNLSLLTYVASSADIGSSSFRFRVGDSPVEMTCKLYMLDHVNQSPTISMAPEASLNVSTHRNIAVYGALSCYDPEGDDTIIEIVSYPKTGTLILTDRAAGEYTFIPGENYSGKDSFTYVARDIYGNYSASATVSLTVVKPSTSVTYADMANSPAYHAALTMTEEGIMSGSQIGSEQYFHPDRTVSRGEFLVMAMNAMGMSKVSPVSKTVFADDGEMSDSMRNYIAAAYELGYVQGEIAEDGTRCFCPNRAITRAEAAVMLGNMMNAAVPTVKPIYEDAAEIPAWASASLYSMHAMGVMLPDDGNMEPMSQMTRGETAQVLLTVMNIKKG